MNSPVRRSRWAEAVAVAVAYYALAALAAAIGPEAYDLIVCWPASGLLLAVLLHRDTRRWPELLAAGGLAAAAFNLGDKSLEVTLAFVAVDLIVPAVGAGLVRAWVGGVPKPTAIRDIVALSVAGGLVAPAAGAAVAMATLGFDGPYENAWLMLFLSNSIGVLLVVPLVLAGIAFAAKPRSAARVVEIAVLTLLSMVCSLGFFVTDLPLTWVLLIVPLAAALRHGLIGSATAFAPVTVIGLLATTRGYGPFARAVTSDADAIALFQAFAAVGGALCHVLAASVGQLGAALGRLRRSEDRFRMLVEGVRDHAIFTVDGSGRIDSWNASASHVFGYAGEEVAGMPLGQLGAGAGHEELVSAVAAAREHGSFEGEAAVRRADGVTFLGHFAIAELRPDDDATNGFAVVVRDVTETRRAERQLRHMAMHDALTGLPNRALLTDRMAVALAAAERDGQHVAVLFCDLDRFKVINDSLGHEVGDSVLVGIADRFRDVVRAQDTVARHGGDEFVVCSGAVDSAEEAMQLAERIRAELEKPLPVRGEQLYVGASIGIALSEPGSRVEDLLRDADVAMYRAKESGTGLALANAADRPAAIERLRGETAVRQALARDELTLHYQPIVDMREERIIGFEALVRWRHPVDGLIGPGEFIRVAEETGAIVDIGAWVIREALEAGRRLRAVAPEAAGLVINVNVSARQLSADDGLVQVVEQALADTGTDPSLLCLELTETTLVDDGAAHALVLRQLADLGVRMAIDDFGAGHSSLRYITRLPVQTVKVDRSFIDEMSDAASLPILRAAISMAESLGLDAVAEGVEEDAAQAALLGMGYRLAQGFHFSRPVPEEDAAALLAGRVPAAGSITAGGRPAETAG